MTVTLHSPTCHTSLGAAIVTCPTATLYLNSKERKDTSCFLEKQHVLLLRLCSMTRNLADEHMARKALAFDHRILLKSILFSSTRLTK